MKRVYKNLTILSATLTGIFFVLMLVFIVWNARYLIMANRGVYCDRTGYCQHDSYREAHPYAIKSVVFGVLPDEYYTGDGSKFNAINTSWMFIVIAGVFGTLISLYFYKKSKKLA
ncbi:MAG: hypothetical protein PHF44_00940 [Candidatus Pacebacteria bacterium]|nr:hypothetical protein [Candidatus Paceibacterota bacterium]